jgi:hypothetical protein
VTSVELVSHCFSGHNGQYAKLLRYQLSSLLLNPPTRVKVTASIVVANDDDPVWEVFAWFHRQPQHPHVELRPRAALREDVLMRPIMRNEWAKYSAADVVWFTDCDYTWGPGCLDSLADLPLEQRAIFYPRSTLFNHDHATGDRYLAAAGDGLYSIDPADFTPKAERKAIGGIQIVPGWVARELGYVPHIKRYQQPAAGAATMIGFGADRAYRNQFGRCVPVEIPGLYRIRHSITGDGRGPGDKMLAGQGEKSE